MVLQTSTMSRWFEKPHHINHHYRLCGLVMLNCPNYKMLSQFPLTLNNKHTCSNQVVSGVTMRWHYCSLHKLLSLGVDTVKTAWKRIL